MPVWVERLAHGLAGVGCILVAVMWLRGPENVPAYTLVSGFGFSLLGRISTGPGQIDAADLERLKRAQSDPPPPPNGR